MNLEIHKPELVQRVNAQIQRRRLHDADELIEKALDALDQKISRASGGKSSCQGYGGALCSAARAES